MGSARAIFDEPHHVSLELGAAQALADANVTTAFKLADPRCRIATRAQPQSYLLRAGGSFRMRNRLPFRMSFPHLSWRQIVSPQTDGCLYGERTAAAASRNCSHRQRARFYRVATGYRSPARWRSTKLSKRIGLVGCDRKLGGMGE
jgi:hypothetical protein